MKYVILSAGFGKRLRPLTEITPKPLIKINNKTLLSYTIDKLLPIADHIYINTSWLADQISNFVQTHYASDKIQCVYEGEEPLETGAALFNLLPKIQSEIFAVVNGDIYTEYQFERLSEKQCPRHSHLVLVPTPEGECGDFNLDSDHQVIYDPKNKQSLTYSGISLIRSKLFSDHAPLPLPKKFPLAPLLRSGSLSKQITGERFLGKWYDVGTPERLAKVRNNLETT